MIAKILRIARVGKFQDYKAKGDTELRRLTLVYGENAKGKTTITSILRSLQTGEPHYITGRKKLSQTDKCIDNWFRRRPASRRISKSNVEYRTRNLGKAQLHRQSCTMMTVSQLDSCR